MMETKWLYLALNAFTISIPLIRSFEPRIHFAGKWKALFTSIALVGAFFIVWDIVFTVNGVWSFNPKYLSGIYLFHLPLGEWLFFITVPYASLFIYEVLNYFWPANTFFNRWSKSIHGFLIGFLLTMAFVHYDKAYTFWNFLFAGSFFAFLYFYKRPDWMGRFFRTWCIDLIGFALVNGVLTGTGINEQVVWYNPEEFMGIRLGTIPMEDIFYGMLLVAMNIWLYEYFKKRWNLTK